MRVHHAHHLRAAILDRPLSGEHSTAIKFEPGRRVGGVLDRLEGDDQVTSRAEEAAGFERCAIDRVGDDRIVDGPSDAESLGHISTLP